MELVPVMKRGVVDPKNTTKTGEENEFTVPVERQQQIGVAYALVERRRFTRRSARWAWSFPT